MKELHKALYGSVALDRAYCEDCQVYSFVIDGAFRCCGRVGSGPGDPLYVISVSPPSTTGKAKGRKRPSPSLQNLILARQENRCFYCLRAFGKTIWDSKRKREVRLHACFDHVDSFNFTQSNKDSNFVAACQFCKRVEIRHEIRQHGRPGRLPEETMAEIRSGRAR